ncbi:MAG: hypothetical protein K9N06_12715 [Candidatus Cloacimonetes bacterium]|nr:hypothetical protein [Candidatus Cloacimonadota bacterium]
MLKKLFIFFVLIFLVTVTCLADEWTENFNDQTGNTYNITGFTCSISGTWTSFGAGNFSYCNSNMGSYGPTINDDTSNAHITTPQLNTCGTVSFNYAYINGNSSNVFLLQTSSNGTDYTTLDTHTLGESANLSWVNYAFNIDSDSSTLNIRILSNSQNAHLFIDDFSVTNYSGGTSPTLTISHAGLTESNLDGAVISLVLENDTFSGFGTEDVTLNNAPAGTTVNAASNSDDTNATVTLAFDGTDFDEDITDFSITIAADGLAGTDPVTSNDLTITAVIEPEPTLTISHAGLTETNLNGAELTLLLANETFSGFSSEDVTLNNAPSGTTVNTASNSDDTHATVALAFNGTDFDANITDFNITIAAAGLAGADPVTSNNLLITALSETITVSTQTLTGFTYIIDNGPSEEQSFTVAGSDLKGNIVINAPGNYEISETSASGFSGSVTLTQSGG